ncbi:MAG TPA: glycosyltransferase family 9 protein [Nevskia sp.]|nr:glycosyltransferase family 9 protein [Nevskia sp.]
MDVNDSGSTSMPSRPGLRYRRVTPDFVQRTAGARKVLVLLFGGLGDVVHSFPALWSIRRAYPKAQLDVLVAGNYTALLGLLPWIDARMAYASRKSGLTSNELRHIFALRRQHYDVSVNLTGNNHGSVLAWAAGVRRRIGRRPYWDKKAGWRLLQNEVMDFRYDHEPMYRQWLGCLAQAGFAGDASFQVELPPQALHGTGITAEDRGTYIHVSPNTTDDTRQLPVEQMVELLQELQRRLPQYRLVLSAMGNARERERMDAILGKLGFQPWRVFTGTLDVVQLSAVIGGAALHLSGDTGPLHLAWMMETRSVSWFLIKHDNHEYLPPPPLHRALLGHSDSPVALTGIATSALCEAALELLAAAPAGAEPGLASA